MGEIGQGINNPAYAVQMAIGPPCASLVPQQPGTGLVLMGQYVGPSPRQFVFKKAHMSYEDCRIFSAETKTVVCSLSHWGKNPYGDLDPLGLSYTAQAHNNYNGEWDSVSKITGWQGMCSLRIRPKAVSMHGAQLVQTLDGSRTHFTISKCSRLKEMSVRHHMVVTQGEGGPELYKITPDLMGRTFEIVNPQGQQVCLARKSTKALILDAALGAGSEMLIDIAPGVDWTAMLAVFMSIQQVGEHYVKDAFSNFVVNPVQDSVVDSALSATGLQGTASGVGGVMDKSFRMFNRAKDVYNHIK